MKRLGITAQKVLLLLLGGAALSLTTSPIHYARILKNISQEWKEINKRALYRTIRNLYKSKLIRYLEHKDGSISVVLSRNGSKIALRYKLNELKISKPIKWDKKWRVALFDVPESQRKLRDTLRFHFKQLGLLELQKSVFVHPYECRNEIDFIIELYNARRYVRFIEAYHIDNELHLKNKFKLL